MVQIDCCYLPSFFFLMAIRYSYKNLKFPSIKCRSDWSSAPLYLELSSVYRLLMVRSEVTRRHQGDKNCYQTLLSLKASDQLTNTIKVKTKKENEQCTNGLALVERFFFEWFQQSASRVQMGVQFSQKQN